jgi:hypothetical protein
MHDHGMLASQLRDMMDWLASKEDYSSADARTVRREVSASWKELGSAWPIRSCSIALDQADAGKSDAGWFSDFCTKDHHDAVQRIE